MVKRFNGKYDPVYFLASLGNGGLAITFFMYLMFLIKHPNTPMPLFEDIFIVLKGGNILNTIVTSLALIGIVFFTFQNLKYLIWNIKEYSVFKKTEAFLILKNSNAEVSLMTIPLALAMTINVLIVFAVVFIPNLWNFVEYMFPVAIFLFLLIGIYALKIFGEYFSRIIINGDFDFDKNNNLSQMVSVFAFIMIAAGFSGPAAMSKIKAVSALSMFLTLLFASTALFILFIKTAISFKSILEKGISKESAPGFLILIPILTISGIIIVRMTAGISHNLLHSKPDTILLFVVLSVIISIQGLVAFVGSLILKKTGYMAEFVHGKNINSQSFALICPGVAFIVLSMFFIHWGLVKNALVEQFSIIYYLLLMPAVITQFKTIKTISKINKNHFSKMTYLKETKNENNV